MAIIDREQIYRWWGAIKGGNELTEIRVLSNNATFSGYYRNVENIIRDVENFSDAGDAQFYFILNTLDDGCYDRSQKEHLVIKPKQTSTDKDVTGRKWILIDLDPKRISGVSSSDEELECAHIKAIEIYKFLMSNGFYEPVVAISGNGYHILVRVDMKNTADDNNLVKRFLSAMNMLFGDERIDIDETVFNASRICKLYGTMAKKGADSDDRKWRMSCIKLIPDEIKTNDTAYIRKIADLYPEDVVTPSRENDYGRSRFDLEEFLSRHGIAHRKETYKDGTKYVLEHCVFDESHKGKDACIFQRSNGAISYVCLHNSCSHYTWKDVRLKYEPDAYDRNDRYRYIQSNPYYHRNNFKIQEFVRQEETKEKGKKWLSLKDIGYIDTSNLPHIPTGYYNIDRKTSGGLLFGDLTIISGLRAAGKTSIIDSIILNAIQAGFKVAAWSGEMQGFRFASWMYQIAAGKQYVRKNPKYENSYYCPKHVAEKIYEWTEGKFFLYNNEYGTKWEQLFPDIKECYEKEKPNLIVIDNLMALNISSYQGDKNDRQSQFVNDVKDFAKSNNIHVILVCHPRKESTFLRIESIGGTADITNLCDNCLMIHRVNRDFENRGREFLGNEKIAECLQYDTVVEIAKNRENGLQDELVGLYFEMETRRLKNEIAENIVYGWDVQPVQTEIVISQVQNYDVFGGISPKTEERYGLPY